MSSDVLKYFYVKRQDEVYGPATVNQLIKAAHEGAVRPTDQISLSSEGPWRSAGTCIELGFREPIPPPTDEDQEENLFLWDGYHRRGPISMAQLRLLFDWGQIALDSKISDTDGRLSTAGIALKLVDPPLPVKQKTEPPEPVRSDSPPEPLPKEQPPKLPRHKKRKAQPTYPDLDVLVRMERTAVAASESTEENPHPSEQDAGNTTGRLLFERSTRELVNSNEFQVAYTTLAVIISIETAVYLLGICSLSGAYLTRLLKLSMEVFVPFESAPEHLVGNDLMLAGLGLVCVCCELLLPLFFLYKADLDYRLCLVAILIGVIVSQVLAPKQLAGCGEFVRWILVICGIASAGVGVWIVFLKSHSRIFTFGLTAAGITAVSAILLMVIDTTAILDLQIESLPPTLSASGPRTFVLALGVLGVWISLPLLCATLLYPHTDDSTQRFLNSYLIKGSILGTFGLVSLGFLIGQSDIRFSSIPLNLLPFVAGAVLCSVLQSLLWYLHPAYSVRSGSTE